MPSLKTFFNAAASSALVTAFAVIGATFGVDFGNGFAGSFQFDQQQHYGEAVDYAVRVRAIGISGVLGLLTGVSAGMATLVGAYKAKILDPDYSKNLSTYFGVAAGVTAGIFGGLNLGHAAYDKALGTPSAAAIYQNDYTDETLTAKTSTHAKPSKLAL